MNPRDPNVIKVLDIVPHKFCGDESFFRNRHIACSGGDDHDQPSSVSFVIAMQDDGPG